MLYAHRLALVALCVLVAVAPAHAGKTAPPKLICLDFNGQYSPNKPLSTYVGPLAFGHRADVWNAVGIRGWPLKPINTDNTRTGFVYADGSTVPGLTIRCQNLGQYWEHGANGGPKPGFSAQAMIDFVYSDYDEGIITFTRVPAARWDVVVYGCGGATRPNTYKLFKNGKSLGMKAVADDPDSPKQTTWQEDVQFVIFRNVELNEDDKLELRSVEEKRVIAALQMIPR